jgi:DNA-binding response OmpR family regulator
MKLILLEDDSLILACSEDALRVAGFDVLQAVSGEEAVELLATSPDCCAMMIDVRLRGRLNGWEVARLARSVSPNIAIIYTTTADSNDFERERVEPSILLQKPYTLDRAVDAALEACRQVGHGDIALKP